ncbi:MAG: TolC family protein [Planctomycetota bacterium]
MSGEHPTTFPAPGLVNHATSTLSRGMRTIPSATGALIDDDQLIACWDEFEDPRLRWVMELALQQNSDAAPIERRLLDAGYPAPPSDDADAIGTRRALLIQLARSIADARYWLHETEMIERQLKMTNGHLKLAEKRFAGAGDEEVASLRKAKARLTKLRNRFVSERNRTLGVTETLIGRPLTEALRVALGDQPSFRLIRVKQEIPANELRNRCDVQVAEKTLRNSANRTDIPEARWMSALALRGAIQPSQRETGPTPIDPMAIQLGELGELELSMPDGRVASQSRLAQAMTNYSMTVHTASDRARQLLTSYVELRAEVDALSDARNKLDDRLNDLAETYELGRGDVEELLQLQSDAVDAERELHVAEQKLAQIAIDLFVAIGGPCRWETRRLMGY